uniref:Terpene synthase N-terminal domain-containing protein n=1 Tax=Oryza barthii TaxID=65489 RepID=A0A0D3FUD1_9ORYZ
MNLVDAIQHLGIEHLFKQEIDNTLRDIHTSEFTSSSLHEVALWFRLLREHGLWVSPDVFGKFDGDDARLSSVIADHDTRGLLSLYNAAHLLVHGEPELEEAISIARHHLESMTRDCDLNPVLANQVNRALNIALPRTCKRLETSLFISEYEQEEGWDESAVTLLPEYLKKFYRELLRNFKVLQDQVTDNDKYRVTYTRKERGKNKGDVASSVECYMNEHKVTMEVAIDKIDSLVEDEWRTLNQARFEDHKLFPVVEQVVNLTASMASFYDERKDAYTFATLLQDTIESLFVNPVPI